jgi:hypothetical protein
VIKQGKFPLTIKAEVIIFVNPLFLPFLFFCNSHWKSLLHLTLARHPAEALGQFGAACSSFPLQAGYYF